jgi:hypothetical protein
VKIDKMLLRNNQLLFFLALTVLSCSPSSDKTSGNEKKETWDLSEYKFEIAKDDIPFDDSKHEFYFPQYEDLYYYIVDVNGKKVSNFKFSDIQIDPIHPFYWGKTDGSYFLYTYPEEKILSDPFLSPVEISLSKSSFNISEANKDHLSLYRIQIPRTRKSGRKRYFFTLKSRNSKKSKFNDFHTANEKCGSIKRSQVRGNKPYHILISNRNCKYVIVDKNINPIVDEKFDYVESSIKNERFVVVGKDSLKGIVDTYNRSFTGFKYTSIKEVLHKPFIFTDYDINAAENQLITYFNEKQNVIIEVKAQDVKSVENGIVTFKRKNKYSFFDLVLKEEIVIPQRIRNLDIKRVFKEDENLIFVTKSDDKVLSSGRKYISEKSIEYRKTDSLELVFSNQLNSSINRTEVSGAYGEKRFRFLSVDNKLCTILDDKFNFLFPLDSVMVYSKTPQYFGQKQITIKSNYFREKIVLDNKLNVISFPERLESDYVNIETLVTKDKQYFIGNRLLKKFPLQGYLFYDKDDKTHVFKTNGEYVSSHRGKVLGMVTPYRLTGYSDENKAYEPFAEIRHPRNVNYNSKVYYVRLSDGYEYHKYESKVNEDLFITESRDSVK